MANRVPRGRRRRPKKNLWQMLFDNLPLIAKVVSTVAIIVMALTGYPPIPLA